MDLVGAILGSLFAALILIYPIRKTFARAGLRPNGAFWLFVPWFGILIATSILAFSDWSIGNDEERN
jgi:hypothetical protein